ncbi:hypothetical protein JTE90_015235 [Oedothorax gibbosus]|uniref:Secreted protein n=1 Tax=Oedothorax gibbosus TaxID=931172 RepID=A0AAV6TDI5_9ARAC|nr:hypothetical protein JTE90_015235 [Oedothorax gibbosus]
MLLVGPLPSRLSFSASGPAPCRAAPSGKFFSGEFGAFYERGAAGVELNAVRGANSTRLRPFLPLFFPPPAEICSGGRGDQNRLPRVRRFVFYFMAIFLGQYKNRGP